MHLLPEMPNSLQRILILCGILSGVLLATTDLVAGLLKPGYRFDSQSASVLSAPGTSTRPYVLPLNLLSGLLVLAFAVGVWWSNDQNWAFKAVAILLAGNALFQMVSVAFFPMVLEEPMDSPANRLNVILMFLSVLCFFLAICFAIFANQNWFRYFSLGEVLFFVGLTIFGLATAKSDFTVFGPHSEMVGIQERTMIYSWQIWLILQAITLL